MWLYRPATNQFIFQGVLQGVCSLLKTAAQRTLSAFQNQKENNWFPHWCSQKASAWVRKASELTLRIQPNFTLMLFFPLWLIYCLSIPMMAHLHHFTVSLLLAWKSCCHTPRITSRRHRSLERSTSMRNIWFQTCCDDVRALIWELVPQSNVEPALKHWNFRSDVTSNLACM